MAALIGVTARVLRDAEAGSVPHPENQLRIAEHYRFDLLVQWPDPNQDEVAAA